MNASSSYALLAKYSRQVPRYTSYPTAPHFYNITSSTYESWLADTPFLSPVSLYLHIPYCQKLCWFCGCNTRITKQYGPVQNYLTPLVTEIGMVATAIGRKPAVSHIHFGGGSPTMLHSDDFSHIMEELQKHYAIQYNAEIAIEVDPRGITEAKIAAYAKFGVNRLSIGVQDFDPEVQAAINREQPIHVIYDTVSLSREYGIHQLSLDLIYGLPKQTLSSLKHTIDYALLFEPNRIALFGYAHVPWKKKNMRLINSADLPNDEERHRLFQAASAQLKAAGYIAIGLDHFVKVDDPMAIALKQRSLQRNFQGYTTDRANTLIGLGVSAIGSLQQGYVQNATTAEQYEQSILNGAFATRLGIQLSEQDRLRRSIINKLMCYFEVNVMQCCHDASFSVTDFDTVFERLQPMQQDGLISIDGYDIRINPDYPQAVRLVCAQFDTYITSDATRHSQVA